MKRVLLLTENILSEKPFQKKLQSLNYEVLVSATFIEDIKLNPHLDSVFKFFKIIVLSETISESEIDAFSYVLRKSKSVIFRKVETNASTEVRAKYNKAGTKDWISSLSSIEEIRDKFNITRHVNVIPENSGIQYMNPLQKEVNKGIHFSGREKKVLDELYRAGDQIITREEMCELVWPVNGVTKSNLSALSSLINRIREKLAAVEIFDSINTCWGQGYNCSERLIQFLNNNQYLLL
ncbi:helix-turn-helix domain-containing protein [Enterococcus raffinosus]|uniref:helix-turn-helix domain-containing protein n=1 Tax=Enterococcus raffinosus TaxID=71452 RepID=UPI003D6AFA61